MKILVTGSAGFIGFHLAKRLLHEGHDVVGLDNINDYYDVHLKYARLNEIGIMQANIVYGKQIQSIIFDTYCFIQADLVDRQVIEELFELEKFDIVCHLAAQAGVRYSIENPHVYVQSNMAGFLNILECCRHNDIRHLIYASSSSVYGNNNKTPFSEQDRVDSPISLYAATKKANELMAHTYSYLYHFPTTGLRFFTVYGPYGRPDMAPMLFVNAIMHDKPIKVFNNGNLSRDFTYIDDITEGIVRIINCTPQKSYNVFNIGRSKPINLKEFIRITENVIGKKAVWEMCEMQKGDVETTYADITALKQTVNYHPSTSLESGIHQFIQWYLNFYSGTF
jgi:UDP-glucuronate 4-epimerase